MSKGLQLGLVCCFVFLAQKYNASFFFIDGVFYVDGRQLDAPDICEYVGNANAEHS